MRAKVLPLRYQWGASFDEHFPQVVLTAKYFIDHNDDFRVLCVGETGTGKSSADLHAMEAFMGEDASIRFIGINEKSYAQALKAAKDARSKGIKYVMCVNDEAHLFASETMTPYNRRCLKLLGEIRGLGIWHWWNTSLPGELQSAFMDESFDAIMFIYTKTEHTPRLYLFFDRAAIDMMRREEGSPGKKAKLTLDLLRKKGKYYATYRGCFKQYTGRLWSDYCGMKDRKMEERVESFYEDFGTEYFTPSQIAREGGVDEATIRRWVKSGINSGELVESVDYVTNAAGKRKFSVDGKKKLLSWGRSVDLVEDIGGVSAESPPCGARYIISRDGKKLMTDG